MLDWAAICLTTLLPQKGGEPSLDEVRAALRLNVPQLCERSLSYARRRDIPRTRKALRMLRPFARAYDQKWKTRISVAFGERFDQSKLSALVDLTRTLVLADLRDRLHEVVATAKLKPRRARRLLLAAKADYAVLIPSILAVKGGVKAHAKSLSRFRDMASLIPGARPFGQRRDWSKKMAAIAVAQRTALDKTLPRLTKALGKGRRPGK